MLSNLLSFSASFVFNAKILSLQGEVIKCLQPERHSLCLALKIHILMKPKLKSVLLFSEKGEAVEDLTQLPVYVVILCLFLYFCYICS